MQTTEQKISDLISRLADCLKGRGLTLATAESCTGGWIAKSITDLPGSSDWFAGSVVCYSNAFKQNILGVPGKTIEEFGAVSRETVLAMTNGLLNTTEADLAVSVSGIAGPGGGSVDKPVGTVWLSWGKRNKTTYATKYQFTGDREAVRLQSIEAAIIAIIELAGCG